MESTSIERLLNAKASFKEESLLSIDLSEMVLPKCDKELLERKDPNYF